MNFETPKTFGQFLFNDFARLVVIGFVSLILFAIISLYVFYIDFDLGLPVCGGIALIADIALILEARKEWKRQNEEIPH